MKYYLIHNKQWTEYMQAKKDLQTVLNEYTIAFQKTQPKGNYGEHISGNPVNKVEEYVIELERKRIKERMKAAEDIIDAKLKLLELAEQDLRKSNDIYDLVYTAMWVDKKRPKELYREFDLKGIGYSISHIYDVRRRIKAQIERDF